MYKKRLFFWLFFPALVLALGAVVMALWNAVLPQVLAAKPLNYWQALALLLLCRLLFGGFHLRPWGGHKPAHWGKPWADKWASMSDEERQQLKQRWQERCAKRSEK